MAAGVAPIVPLYEMTGKASGDLWVAGVDGYPGGWLIALARGTGAEARVHVAPRFDDVLALMEGAAVIAIDIPIGLPARVGAGGRARAAGAAALGRAAILGVLRARARGPLGRRFSR